MISKIKNFYDNPHAPSFLLCMIIFGVSLGLYSGVLNNYLHEVLGISRLERGIVEFPRELPGLLLFIIIAFLSRFSELKVMRFAFIISMFGMIGLAAFGDLRIGAIVAIVFFSTGEHMMMPIQKSIAMHMAKPGNEGLAMGGVTSLANIGQVIGHYLIPLIFLLLAIIAPALSSFDKFRVIFILAALVIFTAIMFVSRINETNKHIERRKIYFRKKYLRYYILEMFFGSRKQVFLTFAPYVLILKYGAKTEYIAFLYGLWSFSTIFLSPLMGKLLDKVGYKIVIIVDAFILMVLCLLYGFSHHFFQPSTAFIIVSIVFVLDAVLFLVGMARAIYVRSISEQEDVTVVLSSGISINHLVSIIIAMLGGLLWERLGVEVLFSLAAIFGFGSLVFSLFLPSPKSVISK